MLVADETRLEGIEERGDDVDVAWSMVASSVTAVTCVIDFFNASVALVLKRDVRV